MANVENVNIMRENRSENTYKQFVFFPKGEWDQELQDKFKALETCYNPAKHVKEMNLPLFHPILTFCFSVSAASLELRGEFSWRSGCKMRGWWTCPVISERTSDQLMVVDAWRLRKGSQKKREQQEKWEGMAATGRGNKRLLLGREKWLDDKTTGPRA